MKTSLIIDNLKKDSANGKKTLRYNPLTEDLVTESAAATLQDALQAADSAQKAYLKWRNVGPTERRKVLLNAADILESKIEEFRKITANEVGSSALWSDINLLGAAAVFREAASLVTQVQGETLPTDKENTLSFTLRQAVGVILSIVPWNGPGLLAARAIAYPIAFGNSVIFRASENSAASHYLIVDSLYKAGLPAGVLNYLTVAPEDSEVVTDALIAHSAIKRINFTGSTKVGRIIAEKSATQLKRCLLELGGKAQFVVLKDANIAGAVDAAIFGSFLYQGQICMSTERFVVDEKIADKFAREFSLRAEKLPVGDPALDKDCVVGPLVNQRSGEHINKLIDDAVSKGAKIITGGKASGTSMKPTILDYVTPEMDIYHEETFGPVTTIVRFSHEADALTVANDTHYGLSSAIFSQDISKALEFAKNIEAGCVHINGATVQSEAQAPYGGVKNSGYGKFDGRAVIDEFTEVKWITIEPADQKYPF